MDNQHRKIKGYRELSQEEINLMNQIKDFGPKLKALIDSLQDKDLQVPTVDKRWIAIGRTHLQEGLMALTRAVAKPDFF